MLNACIDEVFAPESTLALIACRPKAGNEHHSSDPMVFLLADIFNMLPLSKYFSPS
jgi:hypothetical protein